MVKCSFILRLLHSVVWQSKLPGDVHTVALWEKQEKEKLGHEVGLFLGKVG